MIPGPPQILTCPYCGTEKEVMSLASGNTFGEVIWSDNKRVAPMLPEASYIQKCPHCGKYYIKERQKVKYGKELFSFELGLLTFPEMKEAFAQLSEEGFLDEKEEKKVRMELHHSYNDFYYREAANKEINDDDKRLFHDNGIWLINNFITDNVMKAEFYREIGEFKIANDILESIEVEDAFLKQIVSQIKERLGEKDCRVFQIK